MNRGKGHKQRNQESQGSSMVNGLERRIENQYPFIELIPTMAGSSRSSSAGDMFFPYAPTATAHHNETVPEHSPVVLAVASQLAYYFSAENLSTDLFLRRNMDGEGYVKLTLLYGFERIQRLTHGDVTILCQAVALCQDFLDLDDTFTAVRLRDTWSAWILHQSK